RWKFPWQMASAPSAIFLQPKQADTVNLTIASANPISVQYILPPRREMRIRILSSRGLINYVFEPEVCPCHWGCFGEWKSGWKAAYEYRNARQRHRGAKVGIPDSVGRLCRAGDFGETLHRQPVCFPHHTAAKLPVPVRRIRHDRSAER